MIFFKIKTNRASIKKLLLEFKSNLEVDEFLISPRPLPGKSSTSYSALVCVKPDGKNFISIKKFKNCQEITMQNYDDEKALITFFWSVG